LFKIHSSLVIDDNEDSVDANFSEHNSRDLFEHNRQQWYEMTVAKLQGYQVNQTFDLKLIKRILQDD